MRYRPGPKLMMVARSVALPWSAMWALANSRGWLPDFEIGDSPYLDQPSLVRWRNAIKNAKVYLEYGSGGSTIEAVQTAGLVVTVESDGRYLRAVERKVRALPGERSNFHPVHAEIGWTEKWGRPLIPWPTSKRVALWTGYPSAPWGVLEALKATPDFIFVDGRFRAACVLESFLRLPESSNCIFMLDDFEKRKLHYEAALAFATDVEPVGKAVMFRRGPDLDEAALRRVLAKCRMNPE